MGTFSTMGLDCVSCGAKNLKPLSFRPASAPIYSACSTGNVSENQNMCLGYAIFCTALSGGRKEILMINSS